MSYWQTNYHIVWATKKRAWLLDSEVEPPLYFHIYEKSKEQDCKLWAINGHLDHVHLVISIPPKKAVANVVRNIKGASSHYVNESLNLSHIFKWQKGYSVFTVSPFQLKSVIKYVKNQKKHHNEGNLISWMEKIDL